MAGRSKRAGRVFMQHLSNNIYIPSVLYSLNVSDTDDYYNNLCNLIWPLLVPHMFEISSGNTFLISARMALRYAFPLAPYFSFTTSVSCFSQKRSAWNSRFKMFSAVTSGVDFT